jgi:hypothetical protein
VDKPLQALHEVRAWVNYQITMQGLGASLRIVRLGCAIDDALADNEPNEQVTFLPKQYWMDENNAPLSPQVRRMDSSNDKGQDGQQDHGWDRCSAVWVDE